MDGQTEGKMEGRKEGNFVPALTSIFTLHSKAESVASVCGSAEGLFWPL